MSINSVNALINQQYGVAAWRSFDPLLYRLRSDSQFSDNPISVDNSIIESPIFACKSALKMGQEHFVCFATEEGQLNLLNTQTCKSYSTTAHHNAIFDLAWRSDRMQLITASGDHSSRLFDCGDGDFVPVRTFLSHSRSVNTVSFRKDDSSVFATGGKDGNIILWDTRITQNTFFGKPDFTIEKTHTCKDVNTPSKNKKKLHLQNSAISIKSVTGIVFQNSDTLISCGAGDGAIKVWDLRKHYTVHKKQSLPKYTIPYSGKSAKNGFSNLIIDSSGLKLYANCLDSKIYCYNVGTYNTEPVMTYSGHQNGTFYIKSSLNKEETYLVSGSTDEYAYIWNLKYSDPLVKLSGHIAEVTCVAWCNNKRNIPSLVTCSDDITYKLWNIYNGEDGDKKGNNNGKCKAEILPLPKIHRPSRKRMGTFKRIVPIKNFKNRISQCTNCQVAIFSATLCENCIPNPLKRKAAGDLLNENKRSYTDFGPRRLFANLDRNFMESEDTFEPQSKVDVLDSTEDWNINLKSLNKALNDPEVFSENSPTVNLPRFYVDGTAPHLHFSPTKRKSPDWLTRLRIERDIKQEMKERTMGPSFPKSPKVEASPKSIRKPWPTNHNKSSLLRFFKVTSARSDNNNLTCSPKGHTYTNNSRNPLNSCE